MLTAKVSFIATVLNEADSIQGFLDSVMAQTQPPAEIIIVDAGSTDNTVKLIKKYSSVKLVIRPDFNRSQARNLAVKLAKNKIIAVSDAGCILNRQWLKCLTAPFKDKTVLSVAGYYQPKTDTIFQQGVAPFVCVMPDKFNPKTYLPSSRSLAFKKGTAEYPENLNYCEDLIFAQSLKLAGKMAVEPRALVYWRQVTNFPQFFQQIFHYAQGDVQARYQPHLLKIATVFLRYLIFGLFPPLFILYLFWPIYKFRRYLKSLSATLLLPLVQLTADLGVITGALSGIILSK